MCVWGGCRGVSSLLNVIDQRDGDDTAGVFSRCLVVYIAGRIHRTQRGIHLGITPAFDDTDDLSICLSVAWYL